MAKETSDSEFDKDVLASGKQVFVGFWAPWCGPCRDLNPILEKIAREGNGKTEVYKMNIDENNQIPSRYGITAIPTAIIFNKGRIEREFVGLQPEETYFRALCL